MIHRSLDCDLPFGRGQVFDYNRSDSSRIASEDLYKGERVLRPKAVAHNTRELRCSRALDKVPDVVARLKAILEKFADALSCIDQCLIADDLLEQLPLAVQVGNTRVVGLPPTDLIREGIDLNEARMRHVVEALIALSTSELVKESRGHSPRQGKRLKSIE